MHVSLPYVTVAAVILGRRACRNAGPSAESVCVSRMWRSAMRITKSLRLNLKREYQLTALTTATSNQILFRTPWWKAVLPFRSRKFAFALLERKEYGRPEPLPTTGRRSPEARRPASERHMPRGEATVASSTRRHRALNARSATTKITIKPKNTNELMLFSAAKVRKFR
jgi:hypothetical protein